MIKIMSRKCLLLIFVNFVVVNSKSFHSTGLLHDFKTPPEHSSFGDDPSKTAKFTPNSRKFGDEPSADTSKNAAVADNPSSLEDANLKTDSNAQNPESLYEEPPTMDEIGPKTGQNPSASDGEPSKMDAAGQNSQSVDQVPQPEVLEKLNKIAQNLQSSDNEPPKNDEVAQNSRGFNEEPQSEDSEIGEIAEHPSPDENIESSESDKVCQNSGSFNEEPQAQNSEIEEVDEHPSPGENLESFKSDEIGQNSGQNDEEPQLDTSNSAKDAENSDINEPLLDASKTAENSMSIDEQPLCNIPETTEVEPNSSIDESLLETLETADVTRAPTCGYDSCPKPKPGFINVHLVPHTHDDVGWLKTVEQYYRGTNRQVCDASVERILNSVIAELLKDTERKFTWVETAFFWEWWTRQSDEKKNAVQRLVAEGQLEFAGGAWSMNDEACTNYMSIIDQFTWGLRKLNDTFGNCGQPKVGWQIDPFGHSKEQASLFSQIGFDAFFMGRIDYVNKSSRVLSSNMEMIWKASDDLGSSADIFSHVLFNLYQPPEGFCFDQNCKDDPIIYDETSPEYNLDSKLSRFYSYVRFQAAYYTSSNILLTMGDDFHYQYAHAWFDNLDVLIREGNAQLGTKEVPLNLFYSTPSCYIKAVNDEKLTYNTKDDDFFPYYNDPHAYWAGYYTSRPTLKYFERLGNNYLQVCKQLGALTDFDPEQQSNLDLMRSVMGVMQHHDAVTGTSKQHVAFDYAKLLSEGFAACDEITNVAMNKLTTLSPSEVKLQQKEVENIATDTNEETFANDDLIQTDVLAGNLQFESCNLLNISACNLTEEQTRFVVTVYNPQSQFVSKFVRLPVSNSASYEVYDPNGNKIPTQIVPIHWAVLEIPGRYSQATYELVFKAENVPPLGFSSYFVSLDVDAPQVEVKPSAHYHVGDARLGLKLDHTNGQIKKLVKDEHDIDIDHGLYYYDACVGNNELFEDRASGAYIFRPNGTANAINTNPETVIYKGPIVDEIHVTYSNYTSEVVRLYKGERHIEFEWLVGPIPVEIAGDYKIGKEIISRFDTNVNNNGTFYTDSNGRQLMKRSFNEWAYEPIAGNYYPVTSKILINDTNSRLAIINDRSQGGSSLANGQVELMVHRRLMHDDAFGVEEALNETAFGTGLVARGTHYVTAGTDAIAQTRIERQLELSKVLGPWLFFTPAGDMTFEDWSKNYRMRFSGLNDELPQNVHILTLEPWRESSLLLRLENVYQKFEDSEQGSETIVDLQKLFSPFSIISVKETTLGANQWADESRRLKWVASNQFPENERETSDETFDESFVGSGLFQITLTPMQIRTFVVEITFASAEPEISEIPRFGKLPSVQLEKCDIVCQITIRFQLALTKLKSFHSQLSNYYF